MESIYKFLSQFIMLVVIYSIPGVCGTVTVLNTVVMTPSSTTIPCLYTSSPFGQWRYMPAGVLTSLSQQIVNTSCGVLPQYSMWYTTNSASGQCDLVVMRAVPDLAGVYGCYDNDFAIQYAYFLILSLNPFISYNITNGVVNQETVSATCEVGYNSTTYNATFPMLTPTAAWSPCTPLSSSSILTATAYQSTIIIQAVKPQIPSCICTISFQAPPQLPNFATNAPTQVFSNTSSRITVWYPVTNAVLSQSATNSDGCNSVTYICTADSSPMYTCQFLVTNTGTNITSGSCSLVWNTPGNYSFQCLASNVIRGEAYTSTSNSLSFQLCSEVSEECTSCSCNVACIVPAIVVPISVAIIIVILVVVIVRVKTAKPNQNREPALDRKNPVYINVVAHSSNKMNDDQTASNYEELDSANQQKFYPPVYTSLIANKEDGTRTVSFNNNQSASNYEELNHNTLDDSTPQVYAELTSNNNATDIKNPDYYNIKKT